MAALMVAIHGKTTDVEGLRALCKEMSQTVEESEPGTTVYDWFVSDDGQTLNVDGYDSSESFLAHMGAASENGTLERFTGLVEISGVTVTGEPSADARGALEGFGAVFMERIGGVAR